jgi:hypothetical protein
MAFFSVAQLIGILLLDVYLLPFVSFHWWYSKCSQLRFPHPRIYRRVGLNLVSNSYRLEVSLFKPHRKELFHYSLLFHASLTFKVTNLKGLDAFSIFQSLFPTSRLPLCKQIKVVELWLELWGFLLFHLDKTINNNLCISQHVSIVNPLRV